jgi:1-acyl-sn-glycerol-3-phosphate acyltransferase
VSYISKFILGILGWKVSKEDFKEKSYVIVAAPHTSNWDFVLGRIAVSAVRIPQKVLMKKEWFFFPLKYFLLALGAIPIHRESSIKMVDYITSLFQANDKFIFSVSPEGTRAFVEKWKTGFYHIALQAQVPIVLAKMDYKKKSVSIGGLFYPTGNFDDDFRRIVHYFSDAQPLFPERFNPRPKNIQY